MDHTRDFLQYGQENLGASFSPELDQLFDAVFDYPALLNDTDAAWEEPSYRASPQHLNKLITGINPLIETLETHRFFRMKTSFGSDDGSGGSPSYSGHPSPPELVQGEGSTSPSDHSGPTVPEQHDDPYQRTDISLGDIRTHDDKWTYPQSVSPKVSRVNYSPHVRVLNHGGTSPIVQTSNFKTSSGKHTGKRQRQLENPDQTADVRKSGACLPCRLSKTRCHESGVCPTCRKAFPDHSTMVCARKSLIELWPITSKAPDVFSRDPWKEAVFCGSDAQRIFIGKPKPIHVFFSPDPGMPAFRAIVLPYRWADEDEDSQLEKISLSKETILQEEALTTWVEQQIQSEPCADFPRAVQKFLMTYAYYGQGLPKHDLVKKTHELACFFRIWKTSTFWCEDPKRRMAALPLSVQAQIRHIARKAISRRERDIFSILDNLSSPSSQPKTEERMALWACLWQLIWMYRDITATCGLRSACSEQGQSDVEADPVAMWYTVFREKVFPLVTVFYHYQFRTKKNLEVSMDWLRGSKYASRCRNAKAVEHAGKVLLDHRKEFLRQMQSSDIDIDRLLCVFVVNHELKKLNARKRTTKSSKSSSSARADDDCDEDAE